MRPPIHRIAAKETALAGLILALASTSVAQVNSWTNPASGNWDDASSWSLGIRPSSSQSIMITNSGWKAVAINASTPINFPDSMAVSDLTVRGATNTLNTLLLNFAGVAVPLTVSSGLTLADNAQIVNLNSALDVRDGTVTVTNAQIIQDGGFVRTTNAQLNFFNSEYHLTNGVFEAGVVWIGFNEPSHIHQYGGTATIADLSFVFTPGPGSGTRGYVLHGGTLHLPGGLRLEGRGGSDASYLQEGGTNRTTDILLQPGLTGPSPDFTLNGGLLADNNVNVWADTIITRLHQNGGTHIVSNVLQLKGGTRTGAIRPAIYALNGGTLSARSMVLDSHDGDAVYSQSNGVAYAEQIHADGYWVNHSELNLAGGSLSCSNLSSIDGSILQQYGGALVVSNTLSVDGFRDLGTRIYSRYHLIDGTLAASNIHIGGTWVIGDSSGSNRISNPGFCSLSNALQIGNAVEELGRFILAGDATIDLAGSASRLSFADSSGETWTAGATLVVSNWNGDPSGGGAEQLRFGLNQSGLTPAQLSQIRFRMGSAPELYSAKMLDTGEVVPDEAIAATVAFAKHEDHLVLTWPSGWLLESATNVAGPYFEVPGATSPHTNETTLDAQRFFRLRQ